MPIVGDLPSAIGAKVDGTLGVVIVTAAISLATLIVHAVQAHRQRISADRQAELARAQQERHSAFLRQQEDRAQWSTRFQLALQQVQSRDPMTLDVGLTLLGALVASTWANDDDRRLADAVLARVGARTNERGRDDGER